MTYTAIIVILCLISRMELSLYPTGAVLARNNYTRCKDVNLHRQRLVCEIHSQEDEMKIERFGLSGCYGSTLPCAEGDVKTFMPLMTLNTLHYQCYCNSDEQNSNFNYDYYWSQWEKLNKHFREFMYTRTLIIDNGLDHVAEEYGRYIPDIVYIVANYSLPDSVYTSSSEFDAYHLPMRARIDDYLVWPCGWTANENELSPWLKISLPNEYVITGVYLGKRCDEAQYPTRVDVMTSEDDSIWQSVVSGADITERYNSDENDAFVNIWFSKMYTTLYWRIIILDFVNYPSMKCDLRGYLT